jgi:hypothetical protein
MDTFLQPNKIFSKTRWANFVITVSKRQARLWEAFCVSVPPNLELRLIALLSNSTPKVSRPRDAMTCRSGSSAAITAALRRETQTWLDEMRG